MIRMVNERKYIEDMIVNKSISVKRPGKDIYLLIKYIYEQNPNLNKEELLNETKRYLMDIVNDEKAIKRWNVSIKEYIDIFFGNIKGFKGLSSVENVTITKNELDKIRELKNKKLEYTAFALLVYLKIKNEIDKKGENEFIPSNEEDVKIMRKISGLKVSVNVFAGLMKELQDIGYTVNGIGTRVNCKLNYVDYDSEDVIEIKDFIVDNIHLYYMAWREGKRYIYCKECKCIIIPNHSQTIYCKKCSGDIEREKATLRKQKERLI